MTTRTDPLLDATLQVHASGAGGTRLAVICGTWPDTADCTHFTRAPIEVGVLPPLPDSLVPPLLLLRVSGLTGWLQTPLGAMDPPNGAWPVTLTLEAWGAVQAERTGTLPAALVSALIHAAACEVRRERMAPAPTAPSVTPGAVVERAALAVLTRGTALPGWYDGAALQARWPVLSAAVAADLAGALAQGVGSLETRAGEVYWRDGRFPAGVPVRALRFDPVLGVTAPEPAR